MSVAGASKAAGGAGSSSNTDKPNVASASKAAAGASSAGSNASSTAAAVKAASPTTSVSKGSIADAASSVGGIWGSNNSGGGSSSSSSATGIAKAASVGAGAGNSIWGNSNSGKSSVSTADKVDFNPEHDTSKNWSQFQDMLDTLGPAHIAALGSDRLDGLETPGSGQSWADFAQNVNNGSFGMPGAAGYGLNYNPDAGPIGFDPMRQDTAAMNQSLAQPRGIDALTQIHDFLQGPYNARVAANGGKAPFEGLIDTAGIYNFLQAPHNKRVMEDAVATTGPLLPANRNVETVPMNHPAAADSGWTKAWSSLLDGRAVQSPNGSTVDAANPLDISSLGLTSDPFATPAQKAIDAVAPNAPEPTAAESALNDRVFGGTPDDVFSTDGQVLAPNGAVLRPGKASSTSITVHGGTTDEAAKPSKWDGVVDNAGKLLSHTGIGSLVSGMFPDLWNGMGDAFKGIDNGGPSRGGDPVGAQNAINRIYGDPHSGFIDLNQNGVDDRLEGYTPSAATDGARTVAAISPDSTGYSGNQFRSNRYATFPDMPPYKPGVDDEWNYFHDHLARGGVVGYADRDPRIGMIADAEDALHRGDHQHASITQFVDTFGPKALEHLNNNVREGYRMRAGGVVKGPGGPTDDAVPAVIDGVHPAKLSSGEFVLPVSVVEGIGDGDPKVGADRLHELVSRFAAK